MSHSAVVAQVQDLLIVARVAGGRVLINVIDSLQSRLYSYTEGIFQLYCLVYFVLVFIQGNLSC